MNLFRLVPPLLVACLAGCSSGHSAAPTAAAGTTAPPAVVVSAGAPPAAAPPTSRTTWRGAVLTLLPGWHRGVPGKPDELCLLAADTRNDACDGGGPGDWIYLYASERSGGAPGEPGHADTLNASGMDFYNYDGGNVPPGCAIDDPEPRQRKGGTASLGGRTALYGEWSVPCGSTPFLSQRWVLPKNRLGVIAFARTEAGAAEIRQMMAQIDLTAFRATAAPRSPSP